VREDEAEDHPPPATGDEGSEDERCERGPQAGPDERRVHHRVPGGRRRPVRPVHDLQHTEQADRVDGPVVRAPLPAGSRPGLTEEVGDREQEEQSAEPTPRHRPVSGPSSSPDSSPSGVSSVDRPWSATTSTPAARPERTRATTPWARPPVTRSISPSA